MEPGAGAAQAMTQDEVAERVEQSEDSDDRRIWVRLIAGCALLVGLAFIQSPGYLVPDTKFDLAVDPLGFLSRALHLWDSEGAFGQLQNQAYGYLWPMGPFFSLGSLLDLPPWVTQRLWLAVVMCVAFVGAALLSRALGVRSDAAVLIAAFAYATSPRMLSTLGPISIEAWPSAVAPWVLLPLVMGMTRGSPRRMALLSGVAVGMVGGVNAVATFAVIPLGALWLLTRQAGPRRRTLMLWWPVFTALGTLWWLVPLFVMGAYSPPFLDFIETASVTTFPTTLFDGLRGTSAWVPYIDPEWRGGHEMVTRSYLALNSGVLLMLGMAGILMPRNPHRQFLLLGVVLGLVLVSMGHLGSVQGWFAEQLHAMLDAELAPLRNVHKFDPVVRLPMVIGLAWVLELSLRTRSVQAIDVAGRTVRVRTDRRFVALALVAVLGASTPAVAGHLTSSRPVLETPQYWRSVATWLGEHSNGTVALLAPGSGFGDYLWGSPRDEPLQYLADAPWAVRNAIPLATPGNIRMLDAFEERLAQGAASPGLAAYLRRAGVGYIVVRNDLRSSSDVPSSVLVHQALLGSEGLTFVKAFGPEVGGGASLRTARGRVLVSGGWNQQRRAVEIYAVAGAESTVAARRDEAPVVIGGPEDLLDLADVGVLDDEPTVLAVDSSADAAPTGPLVLTDGLLDRERFFGRVHDGASSVSTPGEPRRTGNPTKDYLLGSGDRWRTTARFVGAQAVTASSSQSDANAAGGARPGHLPYAAVDGLGDTEWVAGPGSRPWWQVTLGRPVDLNELRLVAGQDGAGRQHVKVRTDTGVSETVVLEPGESRTVEVPGGPTRRIRVEASAAAGRLALAEVLAPELQVRREMVMPAVPEQWGSPDTILVRRLSDARSGCATVDTTVACLEARSEPDEETMTVRRVMEIPAGGEYDASLTARPRPGLALNNLVQSGQLLNATGSSVAVDDSRASGLAAVDGEPGTTWTPKLADARPQLAVDWIGERTVRGLRILVPDDAPVQRPSKVVVLWAEGEREVSLDSDGSARFEPIRTDRMVIRLVTGDGAVSVETDGSVTRLPLGISELRLRGVPLTPLTFSDVARPWACGTGPTLRVGQEEWRTRLIASPTELMAGREVPTESCGRPLRVTVSGEATPVELSGSEISLPETLLLTGMSSDATLAAVSPVSVEAESPVAETLWPPAGADLVVQRRNWNAGWSATQGMQPAQPIRIDGWQQGWLTDGSADPVRTRFSADAPYRWGMAGGALLLIGLLVISLIPARLWPGRKLPDGRARSLGVGLMAVSGLLAGGVLGGWPGLAFAGLGVGVGLVARRVSAQAGAWVGAVVLLVASGAYALRPWTDASGWAGTWAWPHYLVLVALGLGFVLVGERRISRNRIAGRSTTR